MNMLDLQAVYLNISGYRFTPIEDLTDTLDELEKYCQDLQIKGSVFLATEGINLSLAGDLLAIKSFCSKLNEDERFANMRFHQTYSRTLPFDKLVFKIKSELVPLGKITHENRSFSHQYLPADKLCQWLDQGKDITLLDMRNEFEVALGTFVGAQQLNLNGFRELSSKQDQIQRLPANKPLVTFCTGGIRCEKAGPFLENFGFREVYQLDGGIIEYLRQTRGKHWQGNCFVFDDRISLNKDLQAEHVDLCLICQQQLVEQDDQYCVNCVDEGASRDATF